MKQFLFAVFLVLCAFPASAQEEPVPGFRVTDLPLPRFVSLKVDEVYVRTGPDMRYPVKWIYKREDMPVEIVQEFDVWRKVRDFEGGEGWIHQSMLSGTRTVLVVAEEPVALRQAGGNLARMIALLEPHVVAYPEKCAMNWCRIAVGGYRGWVERNHLWGIYEDEELN